MRKLESIMSLHQKGHLKEAEAGYKSLFDKNASDINLNYLYGKLLLDTNRAENALSLLTYAYEKTQSNITVLCEYAKCLLVLNRYEDAYRCLAPFNNNSFETTKLFLRAASGVCNDIELESWYQKLKTSQNNIALTNHVAGLFDSRGVLTKAAELYKTVLKEDQNNTTALHNLATVFRRLEDSEEALNLLKRAKSNGLNNFQLYHNLGNAYSDLNKLESAIESYERAIQLNPYYVDSYKNLASIYAEVGLINKSLAIFESAIQSGNTSNEMLIALAEQYLRMGNVELAETLLNSHPNLDRSSTAYLQCKARLYHAGENYQEAFKLLKDKTDSALMLDAAQYALQVDKPDYVLNAMPPLTKSSDSSVMAKAYLTVAERLSKRNLHRESYCRYSELVRTFQLPDVVGGKAASHFIALLKDHVSQLHSAKSAPLQQTVNGGTQTRGNILSSKNEHLAELRLFFENSVREYISEVEAIEDLHEFVVLPNKDFTIVGAWSVFLSDKGYHTNHVHPEGRLSAVFYIEIPSELSHEEHEGYLSFGTPNFKLKTDLTHEFTVRPEVGKLVIFPSYFWHGTIPFKSDEKRLTIAFDISSS